MTSGVEGLRRVFEGHWKNSHVPGLSVAVTDRRKILFSAGFGHEDAARRRPFTPRSAQPIASISKSFVALSLWRLEQEGKLDLDAPMQAYLPWMKVRSKFRPFTVREVLNHRSGLPVGQESPDGGIAGDALSGYEMRYAPDRAFRYSNAGYDLLGQVVARLRGKDLSTVVEE